MKKQISPNTFRVATIIVAGLTSIACVILTSIIMIAETAMADEMPWLVPIRFAGCMLPIAIFMIAFVTMNYFGSKNPNIEGMYDFPHFRNGGKKVIDVYLIAPVIVTFLLFIVGILCLAGAFSDSTGLLGWAIFFAASILPHIFTCALRIVDAALAKDKPRLIRDSILIGIFGFAFPIAALIGFLGFDQTMFLALFASIPVYYLIELSRATGKEGDMPLDSEE